MKKELLKPLLCAGFVLSLAAFPAYGSEVQGETQIVENEQYDASTGTIAIDAAHFPDGNFREIIRQFDTSNDGRLSTEEINAVTEIVFSEDHIADLRGIEYFQNLTSLEIWDMPELKSIDISQNTKLIGLVISNCGLTSLDVSHNIELVQLVCQSMNLSGLDVSRNVNLSFLFCYKTNLDRLDVSQNVNLENFTCSNNRLTSIDLSKNSKLRQLDCSNNNITQLDVSQNPNIYYLMCTNNNLKQLDVSKNSNLANLYCANTNLSQLDLRQNPYLTVLECGDNNLTQLDLSQNPYLEYLDCDNNQISVLDLSANTKLRTNWNDGDAEIGPQQIQLEAVRENNGQYVINLSSVVPSEYLDKITVNDGVYNGATGKITLPDTLPASLSYMYATGNSTYPELEVQVNINYNVQVSEGVESFVSRLYENILQRSPDASGLQSWSNVLMSGEETGAQVAQGFVDSTEFKSRNLSDEEYVSILYRTFLGREADQGGLNAWISVLDSGLSRMHVFKGFAESDEFTRICSDYGIVRGNAVLTEARDQNEGVTKFIVRNYRLCLGREADIDGLNAWCSQILNGTNTAKQAAYGFVFSDEFKNKNLSNEDYVKTLYRVFMDREADSEGLAAWIAVLDQGQSREHVFNGFADSVEFRTICQSYGIS